MSLRTIIFCLIIGFYSSPSQAEMMSWLGPTTVLEKEWPLLLKGSGFQLKFSTENKITNITIKPLSKGFPVSNDIWMDLLFRQGLLCNGVDLGCPASESKFIEEISKNQPISIKSEEYYVITLAKEPKKDIIYFANIRTFHKKYESNICKNKLIKGACSLSTAPDSDQELFDQLKKRTKQFLKELQ